MTTTPAKIALLSMTLVAAVSLNPDKAAANGEQQGDDRPDAEESAGADSSR